MAQPFPPPPAPSGDPLLNALPPAPTPEAEASSSNILPESTNLDSSYSNMSKTAPTTEPLKSQRDIEDGDAEKTCRDNDEDEEDAKKTKKKKVKLSKKQKILVGLFVVLFLVCLILSGLCIYMLIANISVMELAS